MIYLHKILPIFLLPVSVTLLLVLAGLLFRRRALIWTAVVILWLSSSTVARAAGAAKEQRDRYPQRSRGARPIWRWPSLALAGAAFLAERHLAETRSADRAAKG